MIRVQAFLDRPNTAEAQGSEPVQGPIMLDVTRPPRKDSSVEGALRLGLLSVEQQLLLDPAAYGIEARKITTTIEGEK